MFVPLCPLPPNFIARLEEFKFVFSRKDDELSRKLLLLISLANGHPRTLEIIHNTIVNENLATLDFNCLLQDVSQDISSRYTIDNFTGTAEFLYHFVIHAFFVPNENFSRSLEELAQVEVLVAKAIIVDSITKRDKKILCSAHINLFMFCTFWGSVRYIPGSDLNWVMNLNDLITFDCKKIIEEDEAEVEDEEDDIYEDAGINTTTGAIMMEDDSIAVEPVYTAFLESEKFEHYFPLIFTFRFNLLVNPICEDCNMKILPRFATLCSFFGFSDIPFLNGQCSTFYDWEIDFRKPFSLNKKEINNYLGNKKIDKTLCNKEMFKNFLKSDKWDDNVNIWYKCEKNCVGIDNFCFLKLLGAFFFFNCSFIDMQVANISNRPQQWCVQDSDDSFPIETGKRDRSG